MRYFAGPHMASSWHRAVAQTLSVTLRFILQRTPFLSHLFIVLLGIFGPVFLPRLTAFVCVATHVVFVCCQLRTAYGVFACWRGTRKHSLTSWTKEWHKQAQELAVSDPLRPLLRYDDVQHCIIVPAYKEEIATLRETLDILASHPLASSNYHVCLGMEEREAGAAAKARSLVNIYRSKHAFRNIDFSLHPGNVVGEAAGKSSNVNWAARFLFDRLPESLHHLAILTIMDSDTAFAADFFLASAVHFALAKPEVRPRMIFVPPVVFDRNCKDVPVFTRATDIFWSCAGIGGIYPSSQCKIPTSAYGVSLKLAEFIGFWDAGPEAIGEDLHFYCKALFETRGNLVPVTIYSPASQCNVVGAPAKGFISSYLNDMSARWTQACRHLWGSLDFGYSWGRVLTGSFGRSAQNPRAYMRLDTSRSQDDEAFDKDNIELQSPCGPSPPLCSRLAESTPSPSPSSSTQCSTSKTMSPFERETQDWSQAYDQPMVSPTPKHSPEAFNDGDEADKADKDTEHLLRALDSQGDVSDSPNPLRRAFRIIVLLTRLYEAHLMVAHVFLIMFVLTIFPAAVLRNGNVAMVSPYERQCTWALCKQAIAITPFAATAQLPDDLAPGLQPYWMMPDILVCAMKTARTLGAVAICATIAMCVIHDFYHYEAAVLRWKRSEQALFEWQVEGSGEPVCTRYLGIRSQQLAKRKWPSALLDYCAIPAGLLYGILPLLYAQLQHLVTNRMTYVVSAKGKNVVLPVTEETLRRSLDVNRASIDAARGHRGGRASKQDHRWPRSHDKGRREPDQEDCEEMSAIYAIRG